MPNNEKELTIEEARQLDIDIRDEMIKLFTEALEDHHRCPTFCYCRKDQQFARKGCGEEIRSNASKQAKLTVGARNE